MLFWMNTIDGKHKKIHQMLIHVQHLMYNLPIHYFSYGKIPLISSAYTNFRRATIQVIPDEQIAEKLLFPLHLCCIRQPVQVLLQISVQSLPEQSSMHYLL